jgi:hypothetical protein
MLQGDVRGEVRRERHRDDVGALDAQPADERDQIVGVLRHRVRPAVVGPGVRGMVTAAVRDDAVACAQLASDRIENTVVGRRAVHEHDGVAGAAFDVGELGAVDGHALDAFGRRRDRRRRASRQQKDEGQARQCPGAAHR